MNQFYRARHMGLRRLFQKLRGWEEVYAIGFRPWVIGQTLPETGSGLFAALPYDPDYWYADPLLFEHEDESYLFCEAYDRRTGKGSIAVSRFENDQLTRPKIVLREHCHLSFPTVFRWENEIFMIPETGAAHSLCLYQCRHFPDQWQPVCELYTGQELCDTIILSRTKAAVTLLCSETDPQNQLRVRWQRFTLTHPRAGYQFAPDEEFNEAQEFGYTDRNAGPLCVVQDRVLHPTQYSTHIDYGVGLHFAVRQGRAEIPLRKVGPEDVSLMGVTEADRVGVHTYCHDARWEVVDMRYALPSPQKAARARERRLYPEPPQVPGPGHSIRFAILQIYCGASGKFGQYNCQEIGLAKALAQLGHTCLVVYPDPDRTAPEKENLCPGVDILWLPARAVSVHAFYDLRPLLSEHVQVVQLLADNHLFAPGVHKFCQKHGIFCYNYVGALFSDSPDPKKRMLMDLLARRNVAWFAKTPTFAKTPALAQTLAEQGVPDVTVAPVALDVSVIPPITDSRTKLRKQLELPPVRTRLVLFVGRLEEYKNPLALPAVLAALPAEYRLVVIGNGSLAAPLRQKIEEMGLSERFYHIESLPNEQVHLYYHACNVLLNLNSHEIFGMSILEAMYAGLPVVARHAPGPDYILRDGETGFLADSDEQLPELLCQAVANADLGIAARRDVLDRFSWTHTAQILLDALQQLPLPEPEPEPEPEPLPSTPPLGEDVGESLHEALAAAQRELPPLPPEGPEFEEGPEPEPEAGRTAHASFQPAPPPGDEDELLEDDDG